MTTPEIKTPRGEIILMGVGNNTQAFLTWNPAYKEKYTERFYSAQRFVDSEVLRLSEPFVPLRTSMLIKSGLLGTEIGSGKVSYIAPYAKVQYYSARKVGSQTGPLRGPYWFERMKARFGAQIVKGAKIIFGRTGGAQAVAIREAAAAAATANQKAYKAWRQAETAAGRLVTSRRTIKQKPVSIPGLGPRKLRKDGQ